MSTTQTSVLPLTSRGKAGLVLAVLLGLVDVIFTFIPAGEGQGPPLFIRVLGLLFGLLTLAGAWMMAKSSRPKPGKILIYVTRILSALSGVPAFFVDDVSVGTKVIVALGVVLTIICLVLLARNTHQGRP